MTVDWSPSTGRELGTEMLDDRATYRVVACLNVWNDCAALKKTLPSWYDHVDAVIAVDGAYRSGEQQSPLSTDGTREYLQTFSKVQLLDGGRYTTQIEKRNVYLRMGQPGDLLFIVDADEIVTSAAALRVAPWMDVGWCRLLSSMYRRSYGQPRLIRWQPNLRYAGRHHWIYVNDRVLTTHQYGGPGFEHRIVPITLINQRGLGHTRTRRTIKHRVATSRIQEEKGARAMSASAMSDRQLGGREALHIVHTALRDDGLAPSRLHTAINRTTPHRSLFFNKSAGPFGVSTQYSMSEHRMIFNHAATEADVVHYHIAPVGVTARSLRHTAVVAHHHGTRLRTEPRACLAEARSFSALVIVSNLELLTYAPSAEFLPNVVPVARYARLRALHQRLPFDGIFRIAHSPSKTYRKGTDCFQSVCNHLIERGFPIQPIIMNGMNHREVLATKATCHLAFDSFSLGMQCSGLEAAAMGLPVIAGDLTVAQRYSERYGDVPYTFADTPDGLEQALIRLVEDEAFRKTEAARVLAFVTEHHDEAAVALRYLDLLDVAFGWRARGLERGVRRLA